MSSERKMSYRDAKRTGEDMKAVDNLPAELRSAYINGTDEEASALFPQLAELLGQAGLDCIAEMRDTQKLYKETGES